MTKELQKRVDEFVDKTLPWWEKDESVTTCEGASAKSILETLGDWLVEDYDLKHDLYLEACKEIISEDKTWFDDADTGYCPSVVIANYDDVYLGRGDQLRQTTIAGKDLEPSAYYLVDCWDDPIRFIKVSR